MMSLSEREEPSNGQTQELKITQLCDLVSRNDPSNSFLNSLNVIYSYNAKDVQSTLNKLSVEKLKSLHKSLWNKTVITFPQLSDRKPKQRQIKSTIVPDIYQCGLSLVNGLVTKELCKMYPATKSNSTADTSLNESIEDTEVRSDLLKSELGNIFAIVMNLQHKVSSLENDVSSLKDENRDLTTLLNLFCDKERPVHTDGTSQTTPDTAISVPVTHAPIVPVIRTGEES